MTVDVTCVLTAHDEGAMAAVSARSFLVAAEEARRAGLGVEMMVVLDRASPETQAALEPLTERDDVAAVETELGDQGLVRNHAVERARGSHMAFLDADDLWSRNWIAAGHAECAAHPRAIARPEYNWFFDGQASVIKVPDTRGPEFDPHAMRVGNVFDALVLAPVDAHREHPYCKRDVKGGFAYEDWHWVCETIGAGWAHHAVPGTIIFKRRRQGSRTLEASANASVPRPTPMLRFDFALPGHDAERGA